MVRPGHRNNAQVQHVLYFALEAMIDSGFLVKPWMGTLVPTCTNLSLAVGIWIHPADTSIPTFSGFVASHLRLAMFQRCWTMKWIEMDNWLTLTYSTLVYHQQLKSDMSAIVIKRIIIPNCTRGNRNGLFIYIYICMILYDYSIPLRGVLLMALQHGWCL